MKKYLALLLPALVILTACEKPNDGPDPEPGAVDTLAAGWKKIIVDPQGDEITDVFFINNTGFALGSRIYKSVDAGETWLNLAPGTGTNAGMGTANNAIFVNVSNNAVMVTNDGGQNFNEIFINDPSVSDVFFVGPTTAYLAGKSIWKTTDGGLNFTKLHEFSVSGGYKSLFFLDEQTGWVLRNDGIFKTVDGGLNWQQLNTGTTFQFTTTGCVYFLNSNTGYITDYVSVGRTLDGGNTWNLLKQGIPTYHDIHFVNAETGYFTDNSSVYKTIDGGVSWTRELKLANNYVIELHFTDANHGWAAATGGVIFKYEK